MEYYAISAFFAILLLQRVFGGDFDVRDGTCEVPENVLLIHNTLGSPHVPVHKRLLDMVEFLASETHTKATILTTQACVSEFYVSKLNEYGAVALCDIVHDHNQRKASSDLQLSTLLQRKAFDWIGIYLWFWGHNRSTAPEQYLSTIKLYSNHSKVIIFTDDIHHVRAERIEAAANRTPESSQLVRAQFGAYLASHEPRLLFERESNIYRDAHAVALVSEEDQRLFRLSWPTVPNFVVHFGSQLLKNLVSGSQDASSHHDLEAIVEPAMVFVGNGGNVANALGLHWFMQEVWPLMSQQRRHLLLIGAFCEPPAGDPEKVLHTPLDSSCLPSFLLPATDVTSIKPLGEVSDAQLLSILRPKSGATRILIAPIVATTGINTKNLLGLQLGVPTVTTQMGTTGLAVENVDLGSQPFIHAASDAAEFAALVQGIFQQPDNYAPVAANGKTMAKHLRDSFVQDMWSLFSLIPTLDTGITGTESGSSRTQQVTDRSGSRMRAHAYTWDSRKMGMLRRNCELQVLDTGIELAAPSSAVLNAVSDGDEAQIVTSTTEGTDSWAAAVNAALDLDSDWPLHSIGVPVRRRTAMSFYFSVGPSQSDHGHADGWLQMKFTPSGLQRASAISRLRRERGYRAYMTVGLPSLDDLDAYMVHFNLVSHDKSNFYATSRSIDFVEHYCGVAHTDAASHWQRIDHVQRQSPSHHFVVSEHGAACFAARILVKILRTDNRNYHYLNPFRSVLDNVTVSAPAEQDVDGKWQRLLEHPSPKISAMAAHLLRDLSLAAPGAPLKHAAELQRFVVLASPRVGSNIFIATLNQFPHITAHYELFHPEHIYASSADGSALVSNYSLRDRDEDPVSFLDSLWAKSRKLSANRTEFRPAVGFKLFEGQLPSSTLQWAILQDCGLKKIVLVRENVLDV